MLYLFRGHLFLIFESADLMLYNLLAFLTMNEFGNQNVWLVISFKVPLGCFSEVVRLVKASSYLC